MPRIRKIPARASASARREGEAEPHVLGRRAGTTLPRPKTPRIRKPRKPRPENRIEESALRPHVLAEDRIASWTTPHASALRTSLNTFLPADGLALLFDTMLRAIEPDTRKNYGAGLLRFNQYCDCVNIPESARMPASEFLLAAFIATWAGKVARTTIDTWLAGLAFWHTINGATWNGSRVLKMTCQAALRLEPGKKAKRPPVTLEHMHALKIGLDLSDAFDAAVYALACAAFWGCRRLGELLLPSANAFDTEKHVARGAKPAFRVLPGGATYAIFHIPWTKTTKMAGADIILTANSDATNPVLALRHHLQANAAIPDSAPLFAFETASGGWAPMTRTWFLDRCNAVWEAAKLDKLQGHCFRIGGATELLLRGVHPDVVATQGGWKSRAFLEYWRKIESILPLFISDSFTKSRLQLVERSMHAFKKKHNL
ncbi:hypothetical protein C2E23DRAFT_738921 [Lenzites betulinus]|nr:hypothetical protein C2E23DRAFT_738921 [Lenzites betulinus]